MRMTFTIPPSLNNRMYRNMRLTKEYRWWKTEAEQYVSDAFPDRKPDEERYAVRIYFYWGDNRRRDIDNFAKPILDAITESNRVWVDDCQVDQLLIYRESGSEDEVQMDPGTVLAVVSPVADGPPF